MRSLVLSLSILVGCASNADGLNLSVPERDAGSQTAPDLGKPDVQTVDLGTPDILPLTSDTRPMDTQPGLGPDSRVSVDTTPATCMQQVIANGYASETFSCAECTDDTFVTPADGHWSGGFTDCASACQFMIKCFADRQCSNWNSGDCSECRGVFNDAGRTSGVSKIILPYCPTFFDR